MSKFAVVPRSLLADAASVMELYARVVDAYAIDIEDWDGYIDPWSIMRDISIHAESNKEVNAYDRYERLRKLTPREFDKLWAECLTTCVPFDKLVDVMVIESRKAKDANGI